MKQFTSERQKIGEVGEKIACMFLVKHNFKVIERNYTKKCGEIDIIAKKDNKLYFIEVKTVTHETLNNVSCVTSNQINPEENIHPAKLKRFFRTVELYLNFNDVSQETLFQVDAIIVFLDQKNKKAKIKVIENIF